MDRTIALRAAVIQALAVAALSVLLVAVTSDDFFDDNGWFAGPLAWVACAMFTATVLRLPRGEALIGAALAGIPSALALPLDVHWLGALLAVVVFALWCGKLARDRALAAHAV